MIPRREGSSSHLAEEIWITRDTSHLLREKVELINRMVSERGCAVIRGHGEENLKIAIWVIRDWLRDYEVPNMDYKPAFRFGPSASAESRNPHRLEWTITILKKA